MFSSVNLLGSYHNLGKTFILFSCIWIDLPATCSSPIRSLFLMTSWSTASDHAVLVLPWIYCISMSHTCFHILLVSFIPLEKACLVYKACLPPSSDVEIILSFHQINPISTNNMKNYENWCKDLGCVFADKSLTTRTDFFNAWQIVSGRGNNIATRVR